jgi:ribosome-binding factor A
MNETNDPRISKTITILNVRLAKDNRNATISVSVLAEEPEQIETLKALNNAAGFIQSTAAKRIKMKRFPKLLFKLDKSFLYKENIDSLLEKVKDDLE